MSVREVVLLGNPILTTMCRPYSKSELPEALLAARDVHDTLLHLKKATGFGRGLAAPQVGITRRLVVLHIDKPLFLFNPELHDFSAETFELWDDCFSFPDLLVKVRRHTSLTLRYRDEHWKEQTLNASGSLSELLQHEVDHLDGILAVARAIDGRSFALRSQRELLSRT